ncbi:MAG: SLBB domain-containing protein [Pseudomonadota bacterium]|nr:SLBB domain-containing protein [Pseudomonadota bacterium]
MKKVCLLIASLMASIAFQVSAATPTPEQIEMFSKLPRAQQEALARQYGVDLDALTQKSGVKSQPSPTLNELVRERGLRPKSDEDLDNSIMASQTGDETENSKPNGDEENSSSEEVTNDFFKQQKSDDLKPFGYELFAGEPSTFAPVSDVPVPSEYILGPGDTLRIQIYGKESQDYSLTVNRQGEIEIPKLGPYSVVGQTFATVREELSNEISNRIIGVRSNITMGELRSIRVFVLGEAYKPASYTISSLSTVTQAIFAAGGINEIGSLRNIEVKRNGKVVASLDLYDLLLKGDTSGDVSLMAGDVVFIPTKGTSVSVKGAVPRPAIYELDGEETVRDVIKLAGGLLPNAYGDIVKLQRITSKGLSQVINVNLRDSKQNSVKNGDIVSVSSSLDALENSVTLLGHVARPGVYGWQKGMRLSSLLRNINDFKSQPDLNYVLVTREDPLTGAITAYDVNYSKYLIQNDSSEDLVLSSKDTVYVFSRKSERAESLEPVISQLREQTTLAEPPKIVTVNGAVRNPGTYPLSEGSTVSNVLRAAMGYTQEAELNFVLIARLNQNTFKTELKYIDIKTNSSEKLQPLDRLYVFDKDKPRDELLEDLTDELAQQSSKGFTQQLITISGDVRFPGVYPFVEGMTQQTLIALAGGLNESGYMLNAELSRFETDGKTTASLTHQRVSLSDDVELQPLDSLLIKRIPEWRERRTIKLAGEVMFPGSYVLQEGETLSSVIERAGGLTDLAFAEGAVFTRESLRLREQEQIKRLATELDNEIASLSVDKSEDVQALSSNEAKRLKDRLTNTDAVGRLVIDLPTLLAGEETLDLALNAGDALYVPKISQSVTVLGEVQFPTSHIYDGSLDASDYISRSGGLKVRADDSRIYVVRANGSVYQPSTFNWYSLENKLAPGDTIVVPLDTEYRDSLSLWSTATGILYNTAIAVAALNGL